MTIRIRHRYLPYHRHPRPALIVTGSSPTSRLFRRILDRNQCGARNCFVFGVGKVRALNAHRGFFSVAKRIDDRPVQYQHPRQLEQRRQVRVSVALIVDAGLCRIVPAALGSVAPPL